MLKGPSVAVSIALLTCSCTHTGQDQQPHTAQKRQTVYVSQASMRDQDAAAAWLAYGIALATYGNKHQKQNPFDREVYAKNSAAKVWEELKQKGSPKPNGDLDALAAVETAGFMREYVWHYLARLEWNEPEDLRISRFLEWKDAHLHSHKPVIDPGVGLTREK